MAIGGQRSVLSFFQRNAVTAAAATRKINPTPKPGSTIPCSNPRSLHTANVLPHHFGLVPTLPSMDREKSMVTTPIPMNQVRTSRRRSICTNRFKFEVGELDIAVWALLLEFSWCRKRSVGTARRHHGALGEARYLRPEHDMQEGHLQSPRRTRTGILRAEPEQHLQ
jgi:hypothetical protein